MEAGLYSGESGTPEGVAKGPGPGKEVAMGQFVKIGTTPELEDLEVGKLVEVAGKRIAIFNLGGKYYAIEDTCPHRGGPLSEGMLAEDEVICPWHGSRFKVRTGAVLTPPAQRNVKVFLCASSELTSRWKSNSRVGFNRPRT